MKRKEIELALFLAAAVMAANPTLTWSQSIGGTQSERSGGDTQTPTSPAGDASKAGKNPSTSKSPTGTARSNKDTSVGGNQSERSGESQTPLPKGGRSAGASNPNKAGQGPRSGFESHGMGQQEIQQAQEALKNQGHDPGPIDGIMGAQTRQALRAFQSKNGLKQTGTLDAETMQKLNIEGSSSESSSPAPGARSKQRESSSPMSK